MDRTGVCQAALDGNLEGVKKQIARGAALDGSGCDTYDDSTEGCITGGPYHTPLGEAARMGHVDIVKALLEAGAPVDAPDYRNETPLIMAASAGETKCVELLLAGGANVNHIGCLGTALASVQPGWKAGALDIAKLLLAAGASPLATASYTESAMEKWVDNMRRGRVDKKKEAPKLLELFRLMLPHAGAEAGRVETAIAELEKTVGTGKKKAAKAAASLDELAKAASKTWPDDIRKAAGSIDKEDDREAMAQVITRALASPAAVKHPQWARLVREFMAMSKSYADATQKMYGKKLSLKSMENDEGGAMEYLADEHLYTWDWILTLLGQPATQSSVYWSQLLIEVCEKKRAAVGYYSFGDDEVAALLTSKSVQARDDYPSLVAVAKRAFPFASCFGGNGALRDYDPAAHGGVAPSSEREERTARAKVPLKKAAPKKAPPKQR